MDSILRQTIEDLWVYTAIQLRQTPQAAAQRRVPDGVCFQVTLHLQMTADISTDIRTPKDGTAQPADSSFD